MLAYSSIGQVGLVLFALSVFSPDSVAGGLFQLLSHTLGKGLLFLAAGYMIYRSGSRQINSLNGMASRMPVTSLVFAVGALSLIGLPPFAGFASKLMIVGSVLARGGTMLTVLLGVVLVGTLIEGAYLFGVVQAIYFRKAPAGAEGGRAPVSAVVPMLLLAALIVLVGVWPGPVAETLRAAASDLMDRTAYIGGVLP
jgi:formate hydrogenlyase subunit 3/multisubunit Na+/H+ antiporter MnhD subunit